MNRRGFAILAMTWFFLIFTTGLLVTAHFAGQRIRAMKRLDRIEGRLHRLHREDFRGKRKFWPSADRPSKSDHKRGLTQRKSVKKNHIAIDFGR